MTEVCEPVGERTTAVPGVPGTSSEARAGPRQSGDALRPDSKVALRGSPSGEGLTPGPTSGSGAGAAPLLVPASEISAEPAGSMAATPVGVAAESRSDPSSSSGLKGDASVEADAQELEVPEGLHKRRRVEIPARAVQQAASPLLLAQGWMSTRFGTDWRERFHQSHRLSLAQPLVFCRRCGHHCADRQHLAKLRDLCGGDPATGSVYFSRLRSIGQGKHPTKKGEELRDPVPLPPGTKR